MNTPISDTNGSTGPEGYGEFQRPRTQFGNSQGLSLILADHMVRPIARVRHLSLAALEKPASIE